MLFKLVGKKTQLCVLLTLAKCKFSRISFVLWMSKGAHDIFALVIKILKANWQPRHITLELFATTNTIKQNLAKNLTCWTYMIWTRKLLPIWMKIHIT